MQFNNSIVFHGNMYVYCTHQMLKKEKKMLWSWFHFYKYQRHSIQRGEFVLLSITRSKIWIIFRIKISNASLVSVKIGLDITIYNANNSKEEYSNRNWILMSLIFNYFFFFDWKNTFSSDSSIYIYINDKCNVF